jgi:hypothetical protein
VVDVVIGRAVVHGAQVSDVEGFGDEQISHTMSGQVTGVRGRGDGQTLQGGSQIGQTSQSSQHESQAEQGSTVKVASDVISLVGQVVVTVDVKGQFFDICTIKEARTEKCLLPLYPQLISLMHSVYML